MKIEIGRTRITAAPSGYNNESVQMVLFGLESEDAGMIFHFNVCGYNAYPKMETRFVLEHEIAQYLARVLTEFYSARQHENGT